MSGDVNKVLNYARSQLGYQESPPGSNKNKFSAAWGHPSEAWCADFATFCLKQGGALDVDQTAGTVLLHEEYVKAGRAGSKPRVGALVFFKWPTVGRIAHVGIVESIRPDGSIVTIEGNTDVHGGRTGGKVMRQVRRANIAGYGYPKYGKVAAQAAVKPHVVHPFVEPQRVLKEGDNGNDVKWVQVCLAHAGNKLTVDGDFGPSTEKLVRLFQSRHNLHSDGVVGNVTIAVLRHYV